MGKSLWVLILCVFILFLLGCGDVGTPVTMIYTAASPVDQIVSMEILIDGESAVIDENYQTAENAYPRSFTGMNSGYSSWDCVVTILENTGEPVTVYLWREVAGENYSLTLIDSQTGTGPGTILRASYNMVLGLQ